MNGHRLPLLLTYRSHHEGGVAVTPRQERRKVLLYMAKCAVELIDVELGDLLPEVFQFEELAAGGGAG